MKDSIKKFIRSHAQEESPRECCGIVYQNKDNLRLEALRCKNTAENKHTMFAVDPKGYLEASRRGEIISFYHSHINSNKFSDYDKIQSEHHEIKFIMYSLKDQNFHEYEPKGYESPYLGRDFHLGKNDCYTLGRDYYKRELNIEFSPRQMPPVDHHYMSTNPNWYLEYYEDLGPEKGFTMVLDGPVTDVSALKKHDAILMKSFGKRNPSHGGIYIGNNLILHHQVSCYSRIEEYATEFKKRTTHVFRHESQF
jgi:proteasome lid subunit RPN8/RPN11